MSERTRTRDLLLDYDKKIMLPKSYFVTCLKNIYPWENLPLSIFSQQLFSIAENSGFNGTKSDFLEKFGSFFEKENIIFMNFNEFPNQGKIDKLYFALDEKILYYWNNNYIPINISS
jgi:hypothetical protein